MAATRLCRPGGTPRVRRMKLRTVIFGAMLALSACPATAGEADVVDVKVRSTDGAHFDFDVTIRSNDRGWDYYADAFDVLAPDGTLLGQRILLHPHVDEQPFTRELYGVAIPAGIGTVTIRARHKPAGYGGEVRKVDLPR